MNWIEISLYAIAIGSFAFLAIAPWAFLLWTGWQRIRELDGVGD